MALNSFPVNDNSNTQSQNFDIHNVNENLSENNIFLSYQNNPIPSCNNLKNNLFQVSFRLLVFKYYLNNLIYSLI